MHDTISKPQDYNFQQVWKAYNWTKAKPYSYLTKLVFSKKKLSYVVNLTSFFNIN